MQQNTQTIQLHDTGLQSPHPDGYIVTGPNVSVAVDNATFQVEDSAGLTLTGSSNDVALEAGAELVMLLGNDNTLSGAEGTEVSVGGNEFYVSGNVVSVGKNALMEIWGNSNTIIAGADSTLVDYGGSNVIDAPDGLSALTAGGDVLNVNNTPIDMPGSSADTTVNGNSNVISTGGGSIVLTGSNNIVQGQSYFDTTVTTADASITLANRSITIQGNISPSDVVLQNGTAEISLGQGNVFDISAMANLATLNYISPSGTQTTIQLHDTGLQSPQPDGYIVTGPNVSVAVDNAAIIDTLSRALNETDQYSYNTSNQLMEIDKFDAKGAKFEADIYDPVTSAALGSYEYASNGQVNEVVDLVGHHDWIASTNGTYQDKVTGAVSQTQPILH